MATSTDTPLSSAAATLFVCLEKYALPPVYGLLAWQRFQFIRSQCAAYHALAASHAMLLQDQRLFFVSLARHGLLFVLMAFTGLTLLLNQTPARLPDKLKEVIVPLAVSFYFVLYGAVDYLPPALRQSVLPQSWQTGFAAAGVVLSILGYCLCLWSLVYLRRSFALLVSVRAVVLKGPYAYVRHPIYLGYVLDLLGLLLVSGSAGMLLLGAGFLVLMVCRAKMEEDKLGEASADYSRYLKRTGFLLPRWQRAHPSPRSFSSS